ncbi:MULTISPECIES: hypothetical protein [Brevibacillus]|jgi:hypothetical protein|uniref:DUF2178 domain-containing protein n=1 Tax=Brevibacillus parabrevis TaxID=54914 RepID=A0A4Y3PK89_BREPA|nr:MULTISPECIES: hypothetical protein [Brevibacillus]MBU8712462.1 hypothetical protein [Brevibacillus parabrevis]MDH6349537.1 hypothetical protein [Brevibacillus sp. 1238]MDR5002436.1 hypothetical protein [Brevibacillus parabrevis]MED2257196.1 hypothetical protein [Brevibacillus parabrevis]NRQ52560.1 hypothetical protein [Brevibacillus sp. HD1.4A]
MIDTYFGLFGLLGGLIIGLSGLYWGNKLAGKRRGLDERHHLIRTKAKSSSWIITLAAVYVLFAVAILNPGVSLAFVLAMIILVQLGSWCCFIFYYQTKY